MNFNQIITECRRLRSEAEVAEAKFLTFLRKVELEFMDELRANGCDTFERFLKTHGLCDAARYRKFTLGFDKLKLDQDTAQQMGVPAVMAGSEIKNKRRSSSYIDAVVAWKLDHGDVMPKPETAQRLMRQVDPRKEIPQAVRKLSEIDRLRIENSKLRARVRELETELRAAKKGAKQLPATKKGGKRAA